MIFIPTYQDLDFPWKYKKDTVDLEINHKTLVSTPDWFQEIYNESEKVRQDYLKSLRLLKLFK
jgi:hypothetical protein